MFWELVVKRGGPHFLARALFFIYYKEFLRGCVSVG